MGRMYSVVVAGSAQTLAVDLFEVLAATGVPVVLHNFNLTQSTEVGDAQEEMLQVLLKRGVGATSGSGGATPTPAPRDKGDAAAVTVVETMNTTKAVAGGGSLVNLEKISFNVRAGLDRWWTPETRPIVRPGDRLIAELVNAPGDSVTFDMTIIFEEI
jgi:hypothetical protein